MSAHGMPSRGLSAADSTSGGFGRMFPQLPPRQATGLEMALKFGAPGGRMDGGATADDQLAQGVPAGFTFLGQLIDHDLTLETLSQFGERDDVATDFRTPRLDLDNVYGAGPVVSRPLYDGSPHSKLRIADSGVDFVRTAEGAALIGDPRNDENLLLAQLHLAFSKFHNRVTDLLATGQLTDVFGQPMPAKPTDEPPTAQPGVPLDQLLDVANYYSQLFSAARRLVQWHYQWIVVHEFLPVIGDSDVVSDVEQNGVKFFQPDASGVMPVEFSVAAFRFGHPTVRSDYQVNRQFRGKIFPDDPGAPTNPRTDLRGGPVLPADAVDFRYFFNLSDEIQPQFMRGIRASLNTQLLDLPVSAVPGAQAGALARPVASLAVRNLLRSEALGLPSGQDVARLIGEVPLTDEQLGAAGPAYLWYYILKEAELLAGGLHLGPVGTRIVAEVLIGLLDADPSSYRSMYPRWQPTLGRPDGTFEMADLLRLAGVVG
ncbi:MAG: peroxidase family protein [Jatrophihabitantaceae bacterium]